MIPFITKEENKNQFIANQKRKSGEMISDLRGMSEVLA
jgi:hypothetical protein